MYDIPIRNLLGTRYGNRRSGNSRVGDIGAFTNFRNMQTLSSGTGVGSNKSVPKAVYISVRGQRIRQSGHRPFVAKAGECTLLSSIRRKSSNLRVQVWCSNSSNSRYCVLALRHRQSCSRRATNEPQGGFSIPARSRSRVNRTKAKPRALSSTRPAPTSRTDRN
jgi:hypothetical protein